MSDQKNIIIATGNPHKKQKLQWIVEGFFDEIQELSSKISVDENGDTFEENAQIKATTVAKMFNIYAIATDGGAEIPVLGHKWNSLLTRRFLGKENVTDEDRIKGLLELMKDKKDNQRKVVWREAIAIADPEGKIIFSKEVEGDTGLIQEAYNKDQYREGIWLCSLWSYPQFGGRNFFELNEEETKEGELSWWKLKESTLDFLKIFFKDHS